jgi:hypothetical protein
MRRRIIIAACAATIMFGAVPLGAAHAADGDGSSSTVTATLTANAIGSRSVTLVNPITLASAAGSTTLTAPYGVTVTEATRSGSNPWSVSADVSTLTITGGGSETLAPTTLAVSNRSVNQVAGGGTSSALTGSQAFGAARTLFSNSGQNTSLLYTGTYVGSGNVTLTPPDGTKTGVYTGTFTVTLTQ